MIHSALSGLTLTRFRSHAHSHFDLNSKPVVLFGPNGAGKTNILEAISLFAPGRGLRRSAYREAIQKDQNEPWAINARLQRGDEEFVLGTGLEPGPSARRRMVRIDGEKSTASALGNLLRLVWMTPAQDRIFSGARGLRLKYYDRLVVSLFPNHARAAGAYERAMRNRLQVLEDNGEASWLSGLEQQMAENGAVLIHNRDDTLHRLQAQIDLRASGVFPKADLALAGKEHFAVRREREQSETIQQLLEHFASTRTRDQRAKRTLSGPHRADLAVTWAAKQMPAADCSTGEQKALLVGLALAHARAVTAEAETPAPLILLDEACAHLDPDRRAALIAEINALEGQTWLTGTDRSLFEEFGDQAQFFSLSENKIMPD